MGNSGTSFDSLSLEWVFARHRSWGRRPPQLVNVSIWGFDSGMNVNAQFSWMSSLLYLPSVETPFALLTFPDSFQTPDRVLACLCLLSSPSAAPKRRYPIPHQLWKEASWRQLFMAGLLFICHCHSVPKWFSAKNQILILLGMEGPQCIVSPRKGCYWSENGVAERIYY